IVIHLFNYKDWDCSTLRVSTEISLSANTFLATVKAFNTRGNPVYGINCVMTSTSSSAVTPDVNAVFMCNSNCGSVPCVINDDTVTNARCWLVSPLREYMSPYANSMIYFDTSGAISLRFSAICKCVVPVSDVYVINLSIPCWYLVFSIVYHSHVFIQIYL